MAKILVLGIGNTIRGDDGAGIRAVEVLREYFKEYGIFDIDIKETEEGGINLLGLLAGYKKAIIIDAIVTKDGKKGDIYRLTEKSFAATNVTHSTHQMGLSTIISKAEDMHIDIPGEIVIYAIDVQKGGGGFRDSLTQEIRKAVNRAVDLIKQELCLVS